ncbi:MAG: pyridoxal-phosphate dependent enzyme [Anaerolineales bacterium]|jgi:cysteine synthase|nr:pyridoxal-phosphate dependent enzyme [Anaerolineales bacterium]HJO32955.1 pyridoxal-phosphate dependent enzyme [Anaerolineales bacterium]
MLDLTVDEKTLARTVELARERNIVIPTLRQQADPGSIPETVKDGLRDVGMWDIHPLNLFRISWHNQPLERGGGFGGVNYLELPSSLTGVKARIVALVGKWFPTGAHKVGAAFGCLVPRLVTGQFDPMCQKAVWPSTGNYCRGGAYDSALLGCESIAILPEGMSEERFTWLADIAGETIKTPGSESNVKEIFDKCWELRRSGQDLMIFNQFDEFGNYLWHHRVTGRAMEAVLRAELGGQGRFRGLVCTTGSAGTLASGDYLKDVFPTAKLAAVEALQCPTLLQGGFGAHRIEGIGDKHVPWIHNVKNTDMVIAVDDAAALGLFRLVNEPAGRSYLSAQGVGDGTLVQLGLLGISGIANVLAAVKFARWYELNEHDVVLTVLTDSAEMYASRLRELNETEGEFIERDAIAAFSRFVFGATTDNMAELTYPQRRRIHNLKYFTWVEQQGKTHEEIQAQWYDRGYWARIADAADALDDLIVGFNGRVGLATT